MEVQKPLHEIVAKRLISQLEAGTAPWQKPWRTGEPPSLLPVNASTGTYYRGCNAVALMSRGHADPRWMTYKQAEGLGAQVRPEAQGVTVQYWKFGDGSGSADAQTQSMERPHVFHSTVYNAEQIDGLKPLVVPRQDWNPIERAEQILKASGADIRHTESDRAFYRTETDTIHLPPREQFATPAQYYAIALHELGHWTGHPSRLGRDQSHPYASEGYAMEELRAEIASMILGEALGIGHDPGQHAAYVGNWVRVLRNEPIEIVRAAADAEQIHSFVMALEHRQEQKQEPGHGQEATQLQTPAPAEVEAQVLQRSNPLAPRATFLHVPFKDKEEAKALGAKWHRQAQAWFVPAGVDAAPFAQWIHPTRAPAGQELQLQPDRHYLAVPYGERKAAKAMGAAWDPAAKSWFVGPDADLQKLARWQPGNSAHEQAPAMRPQEEFAEALRAMGCVVDGEHPVMDGRKHRIALEGAPPGGPEGFYIGHLDARASGYIKNLQTGVEMQWKSKGYRLAPEDKERLLAEASSHLQARADARVQAHEQAAERVREQLAELQPASQPTPYMQAKGIAPQPGVFTDRAGRLTCVPVIDVQGRQWSMQTIDADGAEHFAPHSRKDGCFHAVGGLDALARAPALVIGEAYATAGSLSQSLGFATVAALEPANLPAVAKALHARFPDKPVIIAADDDRHLELTQGINPGKVKGQDAAKSTGATLLLPIFGAGENSYPAHLPAITPRKYREHLRTGNALNAEQLAALEQMKRVTDFNDLANRSVLGREGLDRQVRTAVQDAVARQSLQAGALRQTQSAARGNSLRLG
ncbi:MAG: zincin-like metallopeptidase domain-containing protein [Comamonas sp.]